LEATPSGADFSALAPRESADEVVKKSKSSIDERSPPTAKTAVPTAVDAKAPSADRAANLTDSMETTAERERPTTMASHTMSMVTAQIRAN
jgi:hypothetical protein